MPNSREEKIFNSIARVYNWFFNKQKKNYKEIISNVTENFDLTKYESVIDIGCGTGAFCSAAYEMGLRVVGIDIAKNMIEIARKNNAENEIEFVNGNILEEEIFSHNSFDIAFASYVAHGLDENKRKQLYIKMKNIAKEWVIIHDFNHRRSLLISLIEWIEGGDYFKFIKVAKQEMQNCEHAMSECFEEVKVVTVGKRASWYICKINK
jgi:ubiquinone/menaquinone biosynthesis C-methylase UbiE